MPWYFRKSMNLGKIFRVNFSKKGICFSVGIPGIRFTIGSDKKITRTINIPGTGVYNKKIIKGNHDFFCPNCSNKTDPKLVYCIKCGYRINDI